MTNSKKRSILKKITVIALVMCMFICFCGDVVFAAYKKYSTYSYSTGILWWKKTYNCTVYVDDVPYLCVWYGSDKVSTGFEYKNNGSVVLSQTRAFSLSSQTVSTLNSNIDVSGCGIKSGIGGSISATKSVQWGVSNKSERTISANAPRGYYSYNVCKNIRKVVISGTAYGTVAVDVPVSQPYRSIIYNPKNADYNSIYRY